MRATRTLPVLVVLAVASACMDMDVENPNAPDAEEALSEAGDVESLLGGGFYRGYWRALNHGAPGNALEVAALTQVVSWGNFAMQDMGTVPRTAWDNSPTYGYGYMTERPWSRGYEGVSNVTEVIRAVNDGIVDFEEDNQRNLAYAKLVQGLVQGYQSLFFDQAIIFDETVNLEEEVPAPVPYEEVNEAAIGMLEDAIQHAEEAPPFELPTPEGSWIQNRPLDNEQLIRWAHSLIARYMVQVARTPAERDAVDWDQVLTHLDQGIDFSVDGDPDAGIEGPEGDNSVWWWFHGWYQEGWFRASYDMIGLTDQSGRYEDWRNSPPSDDDARHPFLVETDDRRITGPDGPEDPGKYFERTEPDVQFPPERGMYFQSLYYHHRWDDRGRDNREQIRPMFTESEADLYRAEAAIRRGDVATAVDYINKTRVGNGELEPLSEDISEEEALKWLVYESRIENTGMTNGGHPFFNARGWGILVCGTPLHFPIPGSELETLQMPSYTFGGVGGEGAANEADGCWQKERDHNMPTLR